MAGLEGDFVDSHGVEGVVFFGLGGAGSESVSGCAGPVADLAHVDGYVGVEGTGCYGEGMPLLAGDGRDLDE